MSRSYSIPGMSPGPRRVTGEYGEAYEVRPVGLALEFNAKRTEDGVDIKVTPHVLTDRVKVEDTQN